VSQKVQVLLVDDLDGSEATQTVTFGVDGTTFEIDLNDKHVTALRKSLTPYVEKARKVRGTQRRSNGRTTTHRDGPSPKDGRGWAGANGVEVGPVGRVPQAVVDQYLAAQS
jgi:hypothetical protein